MISRAIKALLFYRLELLEYYVKMKMNEGYIKKREGCGCMWKHLWKNAPMLIVFLFTSIIGSALYSSPILFSNDPSTSLLWDFPIFIVKTIQYSLVATTILNVTYYGVKRLFQRINFTPS